MSAPTTHDPLVVNTRDGECWERRAVTDSGLGLYAVKGSCKCPPFKMATLAELAERGIVGSAHVLPVPVGSVEEPSPGGYPPALPWAALLDADDLADFLDELAASAITNASSDVALAEVETTCRTWRLIAEAQHGHNTAPGPDVEESAPEPADRLTQAFAPVAALREDVSPQVEKLRNLLAVQRAAVEDPHDGPLAHSYRLSHDLDVPGMGGLR